MPHPVPISFVNAGGFSGSDAKPALAVASFQLWADAAGSPAAGTPALRRLGGRAAMSPSTRGSREVSCKRHGAERPGALPPTRCLTPVFPLPLAFCSPRQRPFAFPNISPCRTSQSPLSVALVALALLLQLLHCWESPVH